MEKGEVNEGLAGAFLRAVHGDGPGFVCIWTPDRVSRFFANGPAGRSEAARYAVERAAHIEVYFSVGLLARRPRQGRGEAKDVATIGGLWLDVDIGLGHKKHVPPDEATARRILDAAAPPPSIIVHSGRGLHAYWLFSAPWHFVDAADHDRGAALSLAWQARIRRAFSTEGFALDATHDLSRVLRPVGTWNRKDAGSPRPVRVVHPAAGLNGALMRYAVADLAALVEGAAVEAAPPAAADPRAEAPPPDAPTPAAAPTEAAVPAEKLAALLLNDPRFKRTWTRQRADLQDQSASSYDLSLASLCARADWSDREIAAGILAWRRSHNEDVAKALRPDYLTRTIGKARKSIREDADAQHVTDTLAAAVQEPEGVVNDGRRAALLALVAQILRIAIVGVEQVGRQPSSATFGIVLADGARVPLGGASDVLCQARFRAAVFAQTGRVIPTLKAAAWSGVCVILGKVRIVHEVTAGGEASERLVESLEWLHQYFFRVHVHDEKADAVPLNAPFARDGTLHVHLLSLERFIRMDLCRPLIPGELQARLHEAGFWPVVIGVRLGSAVLSRRYWAGADFREKPREEPGGLGGLFTPPV